MNRLQGNLSESRHYSKPAFPPSIDENDTLFVLDPSERDWTEDFSHENGNYKNKCCECGLMFNGHKRRVICKKCAEPNWIELSKKKRPEDTKDNKAWGLVERVINKSSNDFNSGKQSGKTELAGDLAKILEDKGFIAFDDIVRCLNKGNL
jgi:hypothetical protein